MCFDSVSQQVDLIWAFVRHLQMRTRPIGYFQVARCFSLVGAACANETMIENNKLVRGLIALLSVDTF